MKVTTMELDGIRIEVVRKRVKNLNLRVYPPDGRVRVSVPMRMSERAIRALLADRIDWIRARQQRMADLVRPELPNFESGEKHALFGLPHELVVVETTGRPGVTIADDGKMQLRVRPGSGRTQREQTLDRFYRRELATVIEQMVDAWEPVVGVRIADSRIRKMRTRWGTCNIAARRIWLSLELAKHPLDLIEYVVVHEMVHLHERLHNRRFWSLMDRFMPDWRPRRAALNHRARR